MFELFKSLHIIFVVTWFAGLFYIVRLFVYAAEALESNNLESTNVLLPQYQLMQKRLWMGISWPSAILTGIFGPYTLWQYGSLEFWLKVKLGFVLILFLYHFYCHQIYKANQAGKIAISSFQLRLYNELASVLLILIVCLAVFKNSLTITHSFILAGVLCGILALAVYVFKKRAKRK